MAKKTRLDQLLVQNGLFPSREKAQAAIMAGLILVDGKLCDKAGTPIAEGLAIEIKGKPHPYVSRGGLKLAKALDHLDWAVSEWKVVDLGASTGGFSDCLLQRGAAQVIAVDVGRAQLDPKIANDPRVTVMDKTNARYLEASQLPYCPDLVTADLSFISLRLLFPVIWSWQSPRLITLIKPQFETIAKNLRKGVVTNPKIHLEVLQQTLLEAAQAGWEVQALAPSPIKGPAGNVEFVAGFWRREPKPAGVVNIDLEEVVRLGQELA